MTDLEYVPVHSIELLYITTSRYLRAIVLQQNTALEVNIDNTRFKIDMI